MQECIDARGVFVTLDCCTLCTVSTVEESPLAQHIVQPNSMVIYLVVRRGYHLILRFAVSSVLHVASSCLVLLYVLTGDRRCFQNPFLTVGFRIENKKRGIITPGLTSHGDCIVVIQCVDRES
jgi:hypothetical protein